MPRKPDPDERRRKQVLHAATELFAQKGYHGTSMGDLAEATSLNKGTLYHYFPSKAEILYTIYGSVADAILRKLSESDPGLSPSDQVRGLVRRQLEVIVELPSAVKVYYRESSLLDLWLSPEHLADIRARESVYANFVVESIRRGITSGEFRPVDAKLAAFGVIGLGAYATSWYDPSGPTRLEDLVELFGDMAIGGLHA